MGTLAEQLGGLLPDGWEGNSAPNKDAPETSSEGHDADSSVRGPRELAVALVLEHTTVDPEALRPDLRLDADLELDGLPLWAFVAELERQLHCTFRDVDVRQWRTLGDVLGAAEEADASA